VKTFSFIARTSRELAAAVLFLGALLFLPGLASAVTVAPGQPVTITANLSVGQTLNYANVTFFIVNSAGKYTGLHTNVVTSFTAGVTKTVSAKITLPATLAVGTYAASAGIYNSAWTQLRWVPNVFTFQVAAATAAPPPPSTGTAALSWTAPVANSDGTVLSNLAGYKIYYGTSATNLTQSVTVANPGLTAYTVSNLAPGTWYFAVTAYSSAGIESGRSAVVSTTL
jgi:hypothetical protein